MPPSHFRTYADNLNRVHLAEFLDQHRHALHWSTLSASLVFNPLTGRPYETALNEQDLIPSRK